MIRRLVAALALVAGGISAPVATAQGATEEAAAAFIETSAPSTDSVPLGTVDPGDAGRGDDGFAPAAGLGLLIAAAVGGTSLWAARRRGRR